jgi:hypothetical protein
MSRERVLKSDAELVDEIAALLRKADLIDAFRKAGAELARKLAFETAQAEGHSFPDPLNSADPLAMPSRNLPTAAAGDPRSNAQRHFTDPDSHILKGSDGWFQGYNCQAAVDGDHQIIVAVGSATRPRTSTTSFRSRQAAKE